LPLLIEDNVFSSRLLVGVVNEEDFHLSGNTTAVLCVLEGRSIRDTNLGSQNIDM
jgi:hypothetical protein